MKDFYQAAWEPGGKRLAYIWNDDRRILQVLTPEGRRWRRQEIRHWISVEGIAWQPQRGAALPRNGTPSRLDVTP